MIIMAITKKEAEEICKMIDESMESLYITPSAPIVMMTSSKAANLKERIRAMPQRRKSS